VDCDILSGLYGSGFGEVKWEQIVDIGAVRTLRQFGEDVSQPGEWLDATGATGQHKAVDDSACLGPIDGIAK
jgi:hypothetical protein